MNDSNLPPPVSDRNARLAAALAYAVRGWLVFPLHGIHAGACTCGKPKCSSPGKHPRTQHGKNEATTDAARIRAWWKQWPNASVGGLMGQASGVIALDVDPPKGEDSLAAILNGSGLPATPISRTGRGRHMLFAHPGRRIGNRAGLRPGLDVRGDGGYVVLPPSTHESGTTYAWQDGSEHLAPAPMPAWLLQLVEKPTPSQRSNATARRPRSGRDAYAEQALREELEAVVRAPVGTRNDVLNRAGFNLGQLVGADVLDHARVETELLAAALAAGLGEGEATKTIASGLTAGTREPRTASEAINAKATFDSNDKAAVRMMRSRPIIVVREELTAVAAEAEAALVADPDSGIYVRARRLVRVARDPGMARAGLRRAPGTPVIEQLSIDALRARLDHAAEWVRHDGRTRAPRAVLPPEWTARAIMAADRWRFPMLAGIVESPTLRPDGTLIDRAGHDADTGLLFTPVGLFPPVPVSPTAEQVHAAVCLLHEVFAEFPFVAPSDRAAALACTLSLIARHSIEGVVPAYAVRATAPGTGKGLAADVACIIGTGRPAPRMALPAEDEELRKLILAVAFEGTAVALLDNVDRPLTSAALAAALTAEEWTGRLLGVSATIRAPLRAVWMLTGNGLMFRGDLGRRVIPIDLDAHVEHPEDRTGFRHSDLLGWVRDRRPELVAAALTILRGYIVAGRPAHCAGPRMGSFEQWDDLIRGACIWACIGDPLGGRERMRREDDGDLAALRSGLDAWREAFGGAPKTAAEAVAEALHRAERDGDAVRDTSLRDALLGLTPQKDKLDSRPLGYAMRRVRGRICGGLSFEVAGEAHGATRWKIVETDPPKGEDADMGGHVPSSRGRDWQQSMDGRGRNISPMAVIASFVVGDRDAHRAPPGEGVPQVDLFVADRQEPTSHD